MSQHIARLSAGIQYNTPCMVRHLQHGAGLDWRSVSALSRRTGARISCRTEGRQKLPRSNIMRCIHKGDTCKAPMAHGLCMPRPAVWATAGRWLPQLRPEYTGTLASATHGSLHIQPYKAVPLLPLVLKPGYTPTTSGYTLQHGRHVSYYI
jgi:hypothetical protein